MKKLLTLPVFFLISGCINQNSIHNDQCIANKHLSKKEIIKSNALIQIDGFINTIKPILMESLKADPTGASGIDICSASAMDITKNYNEQLPKNTSIRRTALKYRNPFNKPDKLDKKIMNMIITSKSMDPIIIETMTNYRVYKPLAAMQPCLACHGDFNTMNPKTVAKIKKYYPKDLANGFKLNDFRGVVVAEIKK